jgi:xanthine dehydrogenase accessory factor
MRDWHQRLCLLLADGPVVMVTVLATQGSAPRDAGARMLVHPGGVEGSIGGGQLEFQETAAAQELLRRDASGPWQRAVHRVVLGVDAGQCCGGVVEVLHERFGAAERPVLAAAARRFVRSVRSGQPPSGSDSPPAAAARSTFSVQIDCGGQLVDEATRPAVQALVLYGAGHVARALTPLLVTLPFQITWVDIAAARFPVGIATGITSVITPDPARLAAQLGGRGLHLVMTHAHDVDFAICSALLQRDDFAFLGLIGSQTKCARFKQRWRRAGIADAALARLTCPIGDPRIAGKAPAVIAIAVAAQLLQRSAVEAFNV